MNDKSALGVKKLRIAAAATLDAHSLLVGWPAFAEPLRVPYQACVP